MDIAEQSGGVFASNQWFEYGFFHHPPLRARALHQVFRFRPSQSFLSASRNPPAIDPDSAGVRGTRRSVQFTANQPGGSKAPKSRRQARAEGTRVPMPLSRLLCQLKAG